MSILFLIKLNSYNNIGTEMHQSTCSTKIKLNSYPSGAPEFTPPPMLVGFVLLDLQIYVHTLQIIVCPFVPFLLAITLSILLRHTDFAYSFWYPQTLLNVIKLTHIYNTLYQMNENIIKFLFQVVSLAKLVLVDGSSPFCSVLSEMVLIGIYRCQLSELFYLKYQSRLNLPQ